MIDISDTVVAKKFPYGSKGGKDDTIFEYNRHRTRRQGGRQIRGRHN